MYVRVRVYKTRESRYITYSIYERATKRVNCRLKEIKYIIILPQNRREIKLEILYIYV